MTTPQPGIESVGQKGPRESLSQFIAKILDQLSVTAWLPAGALTLAILLVANIRLADGDLGEALTSVANIPLGGLVLLVIAIVLATMLTQAFGFGAIRLLEGYWTEGPLQSGVLELLCRRHLKVQARLQERKKVLELAAFQTARPKMLRVKVARRLVDVIEYSQFQIGSFPDADIPSEQELAEAEATPWEDFADGKPMRRAEALGRKLDEYPDIERRIMPTQIGNIIRATEERVFQGTSGNLAGWIMREFDRLPVALQSQHDEHRNRLELYCTLVVLCLAIGAAGTVALYPYRLICIWLIGLSLLGAWMSYRAAVASARGYGTVLEAVRDWEQEELNHPEEELT